jgi:hypothetical protein
VTETAEAQTITEEQLVPQTAMFTSRRRLLRLVVVPAFSTTDGRGQQQHTPGKVIEFRNGQYETGDPEELEFLRRHERCGDPFDGFWETERAAPDPAEVVEQIIGLTVSLEAEPIQRALELEQGGWNRPVVVKACEMALAKIAEMTQPQE